MVSGLEIVLALIRGPGHLKRADAVHENLGGCVHTRLMHLLDGELLPRGIFLR